MSIWREVMQTADSAKATMAFERVAGEQIFQRLLAQHPRDGMIYFKRDEAYEALGEYENAVQDFQRAETLFPRPEWKQRAWNARVRVERQGQRRETVQDRGEHVSRGRGLRIPSRHTSNGFWTNGVTLSTTCRSGRNTVHR